MQLTIKIDDKKLMARLDKMTNGLKDLKEPLEEIGDELLEFYSQENFERQGAALGSKWTPLSVYTLQGRARRTGHYKNQPKAVNKMLIWTGKLQSGFQKIVTKSKLTIKNTVDYFKHNQEKRPMLGINNTVKGIVKGGLGNYISKLIKS